MSDAQATALRSCRLVQAGQPFIGKQNLEYTVGVSAESVGAEGINMQLVTIPPGGRAKAHKHATHETAIYSLSSRAFTQSAPSLFLRSEPTLE